MSRTRGAARLPDSAIFAQPATKRNSRGTAAAAPARRAPGTRAPGLPRRDGSPVSHQARATARKTGPGRRKPRGRRYNSPMLPKNKELDYAVQVTVAFVLVVAAIIMLAVLVNSYHLESIEIPEAEVLENIKPVDNVLYRE